MRSYVSTEEDAQCRLRLASTMVCQNIGPVVAGSAGPGPPPLEEQMDYERSTSSMAPTKTEITGGPTYSVAVE